MLYGQDEPTSNPRPEDPGSRCPNCGEDAGYWEWETYERETGYYENGLTCKACGAKTDDDELIRIRLEVMA